MNNFLLVFILTTFLFWIPGGQSWGSQHAGAWGKTYKLGNLTKAEVRTPKGEKLGEIEDFVIDSRSGRVGLVIFSQPGIAGLGRKIKVFPFNLFDLNETDKTFILNVEKDDLSPTIEVKNHQGVELGTIEDLVMDSRGRIIFALLSHKQKPIIIPINAISLDQTGKYFILDADIRKLESAPPHDEESIGESEAEEIYRYYGQHPYWQEEEQEILPRLEHLIPLPEF